MCRELRALRQSIKEYAISFDVHALVPSQADEVIKLCSQIESSIAAVKSLAVAKSGEGTAWKHAGYRSPADRLAQENGMTPGRAKKIVEAGQRMSEQPEVAQAALAGELSPEQAAAVADGAAADPDKAKELVEKAKQMSMPELNEEVARTKAAATDLEARRKQLHAKRSLRKWNDREGAGHAHLYGNPESTMYLWEAIVPIRRRLVRLRNQVERCRDKYEAIDHDALMILAKVAAGKDSELTFGDLLDLGLFPQLDSTALAGRGPTTNPPNRNRRPSDLPGDPPGLLGLLGPEAAPPDCPPTPSGKKRYKRLAGAPVKVIVRVDLDALLRGYPLDGELCDIPGYGPVPLSLIEDLAATGNAFLAAALMRGTEVLNIYHHGRRPNAHQKTALELIYPECTVKGCNVRHGLQYDHRQDWVKTHYTVLDLLDGMCGHHHDLKTHKGWALVEGRGKRDLVPPADRRHPRNAAKSGADPPT